MGYSVAVERRITVEDGADVTSVRGFKMTSGVTNSGNSRVFVERIYDLDAKWTVRVRLHVPEVVSVRDWRCTLEVMWPNRTVRREVWGIDGLQSMLFAVQAARTELLSSESTGVIRWLGSDDLGLPKQSIV
ncbi:TPA: DUF6968 family protein [Burkholderia cenocepacia]|uniref:DUF6968 family protein n=1 Tax=Burkholderia cenocepacia TaxID=95486 RepID=UPI0015C4397A|nr:hypothetical protein [Burkholderia cenocepacia]MCW3689318.1 hypothetical protein [Burkholderia cenocepacia]QUN38859.1 hypothetical protein KEH56_11715 [Burkholderia cenocepacia]QUO29241.1 hypothetical protein KEH57_22315 [Burkholderia cenocepacia]